MTTLLNICSAVDAFADSSWQINLYGGANSTRPDQLVYSKVMSVQFIDMGSQEPPVPFYNPGNDFLLYSTPMGKRAFLILRQASRKHLLFLKILDELLIQSFSRSNHQPNRDVFSV